jgi:integrase/recombinase XerD
MNINTSVVLDTKRKKNNGTYPLKLRVYHKGKVTLCTLIYELTEENYSKLRAKRPSDSLVELRNIISDIELDSINTVREISPFNIEIFHDRYIFKNRFFQQRKRMAKRMSDTEKANAEIPKEWKKKFPILSEEHPGPTYISSVYFEVIHSLLLQSRIGTASSYQTSYNSLKRFRGNIRVFEMTPRFLREYEAWMINDLGNSKTSVGINARCFRAIINEAIEMKIMRKDDYPFGRRRYKIPTGRNIKKALNKDVITQLHQATVENENQQKAKDFWFFSFYGNGMNIKDVIYLKYKNIQGEFLVFERAKTELTSRNGEPIMINCFINKGMLDIIEKWGNQNKDPENYIFPIMEPGLTAIRQYDIKQNFIQFINKNMARITANNSIDKKVNTMETRHSASTIMKNAGLSPHYIKESLGHTSLKTTENYLAGFEDDQRKINAKVLEDFLKV